MINNEEGPVTGRDKHGYYLSCITCGDPLKNAKKAIGLCSWCYKDEKERERKIRDRPKRRIRFSFMKGFEGDGREET